MIVSYSLGRIRLRLKELKNPIAAVTVKKRLSEIKGITGVEINVLTGSMLINFDPKILPPETLFAKGKKELEKYGIRLEMPAITGEKND